METEGHDHLRELNDDLRELRRQLVVLNVDAGESMKRYVQEYMRLRDAIRKELKKLNKKEM